MFYVRTLVCVLLVLFCSALPGRAAPAETARPNIVLILIDDMGWRDLHYAGSTFYETPNIDRLASQSTNFTNAYAACPVCSPTRASIMTGKYPARVGVTDFIGGKAEGRLLPAPYVHELPLEETSLAEALKPAGYVTWHLGKWHLGTQPFWPENQGFDVNVGGFGAGHPKSYFSPYMNPRLADGPKGEYLTDRLTTEAISLIQHRDPAKPFFMNFWHYTVHTPLQAPEALVEKYKKKAHDLGLDKPEYLVEGENFPSIAKQDKRVTRRTVQSNPVYAAMIESLDTNVGRLMKAIDEAGIADNTIVVFTSDNGGLATAEGSPTCNAPARDGKGWMYEGGTRVPFLVRWPGHVRSGSTCDVPVVSPDLYPTFLQAAHAPMPATQLDGVSLLPLFDGSGTSLSRSSLFWHYPHYGNQGGTPGASVRAGDWKLIEFFEDNRLELYNLKEDLSETRNVAAEHPEIVGKLHEEILVWRESVGGKLPTPNPDYPKKQRP